MSRFYIVCVTLLPFPVFADSFDRPIPQSQSATAEVWFALASLALVASLVAVGRLVAKR